MRRYRRTRNSLDTKPTGAMVTVNVYDMLWLNVYTNSFGLGVYHTGVVVYGTEYCYGGHPLSYSGIFAMVPQDTETLGPNYSHRATIEMGYTDFTEADVALILEDMGPQYRGDQYHLLHRNCNHFSNEFVQVLCGASLPKWINRLASVGAKLPFIERSIPKIWLTPRPFEELGSSHSDRFFTSIQNGLTPSSSLSCLLSPEGHACCNALIHASHPASSESLSSHKRSMSDRSSKDKTTTHLRCTDPVGNSTTSCINTTPLACASTSCQQIPTPLHSIGNEREIDLLRALPISRASSVHSQCGSTILADGRHNSLLNRFTSPICQLFTSRRSSSVYALPTSVDSPQASTCSILPGAGNISGFCNSLVTQAHPEVSETSANFKTFPVLTSETGYVQRDTSSLACLKLESKDPSQSPPSQHRPSTYSNTFTSGLLFRLQHLCGTSQQDDSTEPLPVSSSRKQDLSDIVP